MSRLRVASFSISLDGFGFGAGVGAKKVDDQFAARGLENIGA